MGELIKVHEVCDKQVEEQQRRPKELTSGD